MFDTSVVVAMILREIGLHVRERRDALGLSQDRLAKLAGLSRATVNRLEAGALADLGVAKLAVLMELLGLRLLSGERPASRRGLVTASRSASVSYRTPIEAGELASILVSGELPAARLPHLATFLDESPLPVVRAVEEAARRGRVPPKRLWRHLARWARELRSPRSAWA